MQLSKAILGILGAVSVVCAGTTIAFAETSPDRGASDGYEIVILNGRVVDPETGLDAIRNVGIRDDKIAIVTEEAIEGATAIDATGQVVAPGFIDLHAHGQRILASRVQALDGVTTALELEAGQLPVGDFYDNAAAEGRAINYGVSVNWGHARIAEFTGDEPVADLDFFFGHFHDHSWQENIATDEQLEGIKRRVQEGLDEGGLGIGFLLGYAPGTGRKEYYELNKIAAANGVPTFTHARYLSAEEPQSSFEGFQEMISVAASTGAQMHICHFNSISLRDIPATAEIVSRAQQNGVQVSVEAYPYGAGATGIGAAMFRGEDWQARMGGVAKSDFTVAGRPLTDEEFDRLQAEEPGTGIVVHFMNPETREGDQELLDISLLYPGGVIASDGGAWATIDGQLLDQETWPLPADAVSHPRSAGTYSKFLRIYVREREAITLIEAIAKLSLYPAQILEASVPQMAGKGRIQAGADADIVIFDLSEVSDRATYQKPAQTSVGFNWVIVGGTPLVKQGELDTKVLPGRPIRRPVRANAEVVMRGASANQD